MAAVGRVVPVRVVVLLATLMAAVPAEAPARAGRSPDPVDHTAPGGCEGRWMAGLSGGFFDGLPSERRHVDSSALGFEIGQVAGFQTVRLARYRYVDVRPSLDFPTAPHRSQIHEVLALYRLYLMPDHWAGPLIQVGPSLAIARNSPVPGDPGDDRYDFFGGLCLGTGAYAHLNTQVSFRFDVLFDRLTTGRVFSHDAEWSHEFAFGLNVVYGIPKHVGPSR